MSFIQVCAACRDGNCRYCVPLDPPLDKDGPIFLGGTSCPCRHTDEDRAKWKRQGNAAFHRMFDPQAKRRVHMLYPTEAERAKVREALDRTSDLIHCDADVLHAPGECVFCNEYPGRQVARLRARVAFTGHPVPDNGYPCPSEIRRNPHEWVGNRPVRRSDNE